MIIVLNIFGNFYDTSNPCSTVTLKTVNEYISYLRTKTKANDRTIKSYMIGLRTILYYFMNLGYTRSFQIHLPKTGQKLKKTYTDREIELLLKKPNLKECSFTEYRNWAIVNFLLGTAVRVSTMLNIKIEDIDFESGFICLRKLKNRSQYYIPISHTLSAVLKEFLKYRKGKPEDYLFCTQYGEKLTRDGVESSIRRYNRKRGVNKTSIHAFRHNFAKDWILKGGDMFRLQKILRS